MRTSLRRAFLFFFCGGMILTVVSSHGQIDPFHRNLLQLGYDQPLTGHGPHGIYLYYYFNDPEILGTNIALRAAIAPAYLDSEIGFKQVITKYTDIGIGIYGGAFSDDFYEVRQGNYLQGESFDGYGGGAAASLYQLLNPGMTIPLNLVLRAGSRYSTYDETSHTDHAFELPSDRVNHFVRAGLRLAGKEPLLYPDLGMEVSAWFERQWRSDDSPYGFANDRDVSATTDLYWIYGGLNYGWTNIGHKFSFAVTSGGSRHADRFNAWRPGGVLPLMSEFPLMLPGYYFQELTAKRFTHLYASYEFPLDKAHRLQFRIEAASAYLNYLNGFEQRGPWQTGVGCGLTYTPKNNSCRIIIRYGYGFDAIRGDHVGAHSVGLLFQYDFETLFKKWRRDKTP